MDLKTTRAWLARHREDDEGLDTSAGDLMFRLAEHVTLDSEPQWQLTAAFGALVQLWRIDHGMSVEKLAQHAAIDVDEIQSIEENEEYRPEPQTVCSLASIMKVPEVSLLRLSGNILEQDPEFREHSLAFAANAKQWNQISKEQRRLLQQYMSYLSAR